MVYSGEWVMINYHKDRGLFETGNFLFFQIIDLL